MAVYKRDIADINLETGNIQRTFLNHSIGLHDKKADHFGIRVFRNGEPVDLSGVSVQGVFMPPQGSPIAITSGNIVSGNVAEVVLPDACYNYDGQFCLAIRLVDVTNSVTDTVRIVDGVVDNTHSGGTISPLPVEPTWAEIKAAYEQAVTVIDKSVRFDTTQSLTDTQKATARENIGAASVGTANELAMDIGALAEGFANESYMDLGNKYMPFRRGYYSTPAVGSTSSYQSNSQYFYALVMCQPGDILHAHCYGNSTVYAWAFLDSNLKVLSRGGTGNFEGTQTAPASTSYVLVNVDISHMSTGFYAWVGEAATGDQISDLKSALVRNFDISKNADFVNIGSVTNLTDWQNGYIRDDGTVGTATKQCRTAFRSFTSAYIMTFTPKTGYEMNIAKYTSNTPDTFVGFIVKNLTDGSITIDVSSGYFCFVVHKLDNTAITPETLPTDIVTYQMQTLAKGAEMSYYWQSGYVRLSDGERIIVTNRIMTNGYIDDSVQRIKAKDGYCFRVHAYNSSDTYIGTYNDKDAFAKTGSSKNLTEFDFSPYDYKYKITLLKTDDTDIVPRIGNTALFETAFSPSVNVDADTTANMCLAGICTSLDDDKLPFHKGFLFHEFGEGIRKLYYGSSFDKMKYIPVNTLADVINRNFAISPRDGTIIFYVIASGVGRVRVLKDGKTYNTAYVQMPWLYNSGVDFIEDGNGDEYCVFAEYGANPGGAMKVYRGKYPYTSESDWETVLSVTGETDIHHFHQVRRDPWTNILYLTSGDENNLTHWWYSTDYGETWTELVDGTDVVDTWGTMACRTINFIFTKDYIYWATDSYKNHMLCRIQRDAETGIIDLSTFEKLATLTEGCATNSLCYSEAPHGLFMYERVDSGATAYYGTPVTMQFYNLDTNTLEDVVTLGLTEDTWGGSRGKCYINYTNPNQPYPAMGFDGQTPCIFDLVYDDPSKIGTIVYDVKGKTVKDVLL